VTDNAPFAVTGTAICVPLADLAGAVRALAAGEDRLARAPPSVGGLDVQEAGSLELDLRRFADHWEHGVTTLEHGVAALRTALAEAHDAYAHHEHALATHLGGSS
jgi:hypothetical protein